ncbi:glutathione S-transferase family protein [Balneatrix alpica]|uniref:Glutathione S-transferase family protein n=1 Tax=Balneatrix alpica TaxID=75684 RepID=A0ABV5ZDN4_9GAMM|nr:glutathione S-transferase N-terminal domain-containing protein [Balneatrix alpica]
MKLVGSGTSPYVRRIRLLLVDQPYEFVDLNIYGEGREVLRQHSPTLQIPMLQDGEQALYDSRIIGRYLCAKLGHAPLSWQQENLLTLADAVNDANVVLLLSKRSELPVEEDRLYYRLQRERTASCLAALEQQAAQGAFNEWNFASICLYCMLDWVAFRELVALSDYPALQKFWQQNQQRPGVQATDPRLAV